MGVTEVGRVRRGPTHRGTEGGLGMTGFLGGWGGTDGFPIENVGNDRRGENDREGEVGRGFLTGIRGCDSVPAFVINRGVDYGACV